MVAASFFIFSLTQLYINTETDPHLEEHIYNIEQTLEYIFSTAIDQESSNSIGSKQAFEKFTKKTQQKNKGERITWKNPEELDFLDTPLLCFKFSANNIPLIVWDKGGPLPVVTGYIYLIPKEGLFLLWQSDEQKKEEKMERTLISPLVTKLSYDYYDQENNTWEQSEKPLESSEGELRLPEVLTLTFQYHGQEEKLRANLPLTSSDALVY